jgi:hypothetical protein
MDDLLTHFKTEHDWQDVRAVKDDNGVKIQAVNRGRVSQFIDRCKRAQADASRLRTKGESSTDLSAYLGPNDIKDRWRKFRDRRHSVVPIEDVP